MRKGAARIEFYAVKDDVRRLFEAGYNIRLAYEHLIGEKKITMSYASFNGYVKKGKNKNENQATQQGRKGPVVTPEASSTGFVHNSLADPDKIY